MKKKKDDPDLLEDSVAVCHDGIAFVLCSQQRLADTLSCLNKRVSD